MHTIRLAPLPNLGERCWFCDEYFDLGSPAFVQMSSNVSSSYRIPTRVTTWTEHEIRIPRCVRCGSVHDKIRKAVKRITWALVLILLLIAPVAACFKERDVRAAGTVFVLGLLLSPWLAMISRALVRALWPMPKGVHQVAYAEKYLLIADRTKEGWTVGPPPGSSKRMTSGIHEPIPLGIYGFCGC